MLLQVNWSQDRFEEIQESLSPFLQSAGFLLNKLTFVPVAAMEGINLVEKPKNPELDAWYSGPTLVDILGEQTLVLQRS